MSGGPACQCEEQQKGLLAREWEILDFQCNYSAFNGYHRTPSDYSCVHCKSCGAVWRTKADYVYKMFRANMKAEDMR